MADYRDPNHLDPNENFSITQLVKFIREKMFGIDVRESIAKALERVYEDASKTGNANMEVSEARGLFDLLKDRLNDIDYRLTQKSDKSYVDAVIASISTGGPKELFYSLGALKSKYPNGKEGTYLVFDSSHQDGAHSYMWKDGVWTDLGAYLLAPIMEVVQDYGNLLKNGWLESADISKFWGTNEAKITRVVNSDRNWLHVEGTNELDYQGVSYNLNANTIKFGETYRFSALVRTNKYSRLTVGFRYLNKDGSLNPFQYADLVDNLTPEIGQILAIDQEFYFPIPKDVDSFSNIQIVIQQRGDKPCDFDVARLNLAPNYMKWDKTTNVTNTLNSTKNIVNKLGKKWIKLQHNVANQSVIFDVTDNQLGISRDYDFNFTLLSEYDAQFIIYVEYLTETSVYKKPIKNVFNVKANDINQITTNLFFEKIENVIKKRIVVECRNQNNIFYLTDIDLKTEHSDYPGNISPSKQVNLSIESKVGKKFIRAHGTKNEDWEGIFIEIPGKYLNEKSFGQTLRTSFLIQSAEDVELSVYLRYHYLGSSVASDLKIKTLNQTAGVYNKATIDFKLPQPTSELYRALIFVTKRNNVLTDFSIADIDFDVATFNQRNEDDDTSLAQKLKGDSLFAINVDITDSELADGNKHHTTMQWVDGDGNLVTEYVDASYQGDSSLNFQKKSFRLRAFTDDTYTKKKKIQWVTGAKPTSDCNLKAYWVDWTISNNLVISDEIRKLTLINNEGLDPKQVFDVNQEQVVGYPCSLFMREGYYGLFGLSTKKTDAINADDEDPLQCAIQGSINSDVTAFRSDTAAFDEDIDFVVEVPDDLTPELKASFEELMALTNSGTDAEFVANIGNKVNIPSVANAFLAYMIYCISDVWTKNTIFETRDGVKWNVVCYDHDLAYGSDFRGISYNKNMRSLTTSTMINKHKLIQRLFENGLIQQEIVTRYQKFVAHRSLIDILDHFENFWLSVGADNYEKNHKRWPTQPYHDLNSFKDIKQNIINRWDFVEEEMTLEKLNQFIKD